MSENGQMNQPQMNPEMSAPQTSASVRPGGSNKLVLVGVIAVVAVVGFVVMQMMANSANNAARRGTETGTPVPAAQDMNDMDHTLPASTTNQGGTQQVTSEDSAVALTVEGGSYYYRPNIIKVKKGATVTITLNSVDMMHDFVIDELGVESEIVGAGDTTTVTFVADEAGEFEFYCSVSDHRAMGMVGTLIVEE